MNEGSDRGGVGVEERLVIHTWLNCYERGEWARVGVGERLVIHTWLNCLCTQYIPLLPCKDSES